MSKIVIVAGMHRSGTSLAALFLNKLGVNMGDSFLPSSSANPTGHYEDLDFLKIHTEILNNCKGDWDSPPERSVLNREWKNHFDIIQRKINRENRDKLMWGWKDPRTSLFLIKYFDIINNPLVVYCKRDSCDVEKSLLERNKFSKKYTRILKQYYDKEIEEALDSHPNVRRIEINFKDMMTNPSETMNVLEKFVGVKSDYKYRIKDIIIEKKKIRNIKIKLKKKETNELILKAFLNPQKALIVLNKRIIRSIWRRRWYKCHV